jgi:membrane associated rhomboid family serine protease
VTAGLCALALLATLAWWNQAEVSFLFSDARAFHGETWRLLTSCLPHVNLLHLVFNLYWIWVFGTLVEDAFGQARTGALLLFLAAGSSAVAGAFGEDGVGLSGVGYGLFALLWVLGRYDRYFREAVDNQTTVLFVGWFFVCIVLTHADAMRVGNIAHGAGAALGALAGLAVAERRFRPLLAALTAGVFLSALTAGFFWRPGATAGALQPEDLAHLGEPNFPEEAAPVEVEPALAAGDKDEPKRRAAERLLSLRRAAQAQLSRAVPARTLDFNRAYADLTFAFALARLGQEQASRELLGSAAVRLGRGDAVHRCLLAGYAYRIEQALAGRPHAGPLPARVFTPLAKAGGGTDRIGRYMVDRLRERSRVLEPEERVNPFAPWQSGVDGLFKELTALADVKDVTALEAGVRRLLKRAGEGKDNAPRLRVLAGVLALTDRAGEALAAELLRDAGALARELAGSDDRELLTQTGVLLERALHLAAARGRQGDAKDLAVLAAAWLKRAAREGRLDQSGNLADEALRALHRLDLRDEARRLLERAGEGLPRDKDLESLRGRYGKRWPDALNALLPQASGWLRAGRPDRAAPALAEARALLLPAKAVAPDQRLHHVAYARLACAYTRAVGHEQPAEALKRLEELFQGMELRPDTFTTSTHYALLELSVVEAAALALLPSEP